MSDHTLISQISGSYKSLDKYLFVNSSLHIVHLAHICLAVQSHSEPLSQYIFQPQIERSTQFISSQLYDVISTLLLNYVAINIADYFLFGPWKGKDNFPYTPIFPEEARFDRIGFGRVHIGLFIALVLVVLLYIMLYNTKTGYKLRLTGSSLKAAKYAGININKTMFIVFLMSGALAGLAGVGQICGIEYKLHQHISTGYGYTGIIVAWLARSNPFIIVIFAIFLSILLKGADSLQIAMRLPAAVGTVMQALILFAILGSELFKNYNVKLIRGK